MTWYQQFLIFIATTTTSERTFDPSCNAEYIGDGYCDGDNNNEMCFYDDNDCCIEHEHFCEGCQGQTCVCHSDGINYCGGSKLIFTLLNINVFFIDFC